MSNRSNQIQLHDPARHINAEGNVSIAVAVPSKAPWEWSCLLSTLHHINWRIRERAISIKLVGANFVVESTAPLDLQYLGIFPAQETINILSDMDILYCPQKFASTHEAESKKNLPVELPFFMASGRPIIVHAPEYSAAAQLLYPHQACARSQSHESINIDLFNAIDRLIFDADFYSNISKNSHNLISGSEELRAMLNDNNQFVRLPESAK